jgi:hypothetical protein
MRSQHKQPPTSCPVTVTDARAVTQARFDELVEFCQAGDFAFWHFEKQLFVLMAALGVSLIRLFLVARRQRLDVQPYLENGRYRLGDENSKRTLKTAYGKVTYARQYLAGRDGQSGFFPLDTQLGLTNDRLSPWVMQ